MSIDRNAQQNFLFNYIPEIHVSIDESMVPYYRSHGYKQYMQTKLVKFGCKLWVAATTHDYGIQFCSYAGNDSSYDNKLGLGVAQYSCHLAQSCHRFMIITTILSRIIFSQAVDF